MHPVNGPLLADVSVAAGAAFDDTFTADAPPETRDGVRRAVADIVSYSIRAYLDRLGAAD